MTFLVSDAALHRGVDAEDLADGFPERLGAVDHHEHALLDIQATLDEVREQRGGDGGVLGRAVPEPERMLDAVGVDPERDDAATALQIDPVEHQHRQAQVVERAAHQLDQVLARARDELATDRRLARRPGDRVDLLADRLARPRVAARRDAREHALEHHVAEPVARGEVPIGLKLDLVLAVGAARPRPADRHPPPTERDLAVLVPVPHRAAVRQVLALRADDLVDLGLDQLVQHTQPDADAERQQPFLRGAGQLPERLHHRLGQPLNALLVRRDRRSRYGPHAVGPPVLVDLVSHPSRSQQDRTRREDRRHQVLRATGQPREDSDDELRSRTTGRDRRAD